MTIRYILICSEVFRNADGRNHQIGFWCHASWSNEPGIQPESDTRFSETSISKKKLYVTLTQTLTLILIRIPDLSIPGSHAQTNSPNPNPNPKPNSKPNPRSGPNPNPDPNPNTNPNPNPSPNRAAYVAFSSLLVHSVGKCRSRSRPHPKRVLAGGVSCHAYTLVRERGHPSGDPNANPCRVPQI